MAIIWFYGSVTNYVLRNNFSVSIVCMTIDPIENDTSVNDTANVTGLHDDTCEEISQSGYDVRSLFTHESVIDGIEEKICILYGFPCEMDFFHHESPNPARVA